MPKNVTADPAAVAAVLHQAEVLWLALADAEGPHCVPVNFAQDGNTLYIHSGLKGRKAACLDSGAPLAFATAVDIALKKSDDNACELGYHFRSVMGRGAPRRLDNAEKLRGLDILTLKYAGREMPYKDKVLSITAVYAIDIAEATTRVK